MLENASLLRPRTPEEAQLSEAPIEQRLQVDQETLIRLLPIAAVELSTSEQQTMQAYQSLQLVLGPVAAAPMTCSDSCPVAFRDACPLVTIGKEPTGSKCPWEQQYIGEKFLAYMRELEQTLDTLLESERVSISSLVMLDLQERRCNMVLAFAENACLTSRSVKDVDAESGTPIAWEDVVHLNAERLNQISINRRPILRDLELTREMQTKRNKALGNLKAGNSRDLSTVQSEKADRVRAALLGRPA